MFARYLVGAICSFAWLLMGSSVAHAQLSVTDFASHLSQSSPVSEAVCNPEAGEVPSPFGFATLGDSCCTGNDILVSQGQYSGHYYCSDRAILSLQSRDPGRVFAKKFDEVPGIFLPGRIMTLGKFRVGDPVTNGEGFLGYPFSWIENFSYVGLTSSGFPLEDTDRIRVTASPDSHVRIPLNMSCDLGQEYGNYGCTTSNRYAYQVYSSNEALSEYPVPAEGACPDGYVSLNSLRYSGNATYFKRFPLLKFPFSAPDAGVSANYHLPYNVCRLEMKPVSSSCSESIERAAASVNPSSHISATVVSDADFNTSLVKFIAEDFSPVTGGGYTFGENDENYCAVYSYRPDGHDNILKKRGVDAMRIFIYWDNASESFVDVRNGDSGFPADFPSPYMCGVVSGDHTEITHHGSLVTIAARNQRGEVSSEQNFSYEDVFDNNYIGGLDYIRDKISLFAYEGTGPGLGHPLGGCGGKNRDFSRSTLAIFGSSYTFSPLKTSFAGDELGDIEDSLYYYYNCADASNLVPHNNDYLYMYYRHRCGNGPYRAWGTKWDWTGYCYTLPVTTRLSLSDEEVAGLNINECYTYGYRWDVIYNPEDVSDVGGCAK